MVSEYTVPAERPSVLVDAAAVGEPICPYIYSQFIEHLGRCIYGGIWAEMLEDRKFYDPIGEADSPWRAVGRPGSVQMDEDDPFVGEHTPCITLPGDGTAAGISQAGLTLVAGKGYEGRIQIAGDYEAAPISVSLVWGEGPDEHETVTITPIGREYAKYPLRFTAGASTENARLEITAAGTGSFRVGAVSLMPADNVRGMRPHTLAAIKDLNSPLYRWPGGNFVSGYDWRDGIGDPDRRPPRRNPAWRGIEHNDFGIHEFIDFCQEVGTEPLIVVNTGFGDAYSAAQEVEYVNGTPDTPMGQWRSKNGHREPFNVRWWGIGNEMFGTWQLGYMALEQYVHKHREFERRMRKVDPTIKTIGVGEAGEWSEGTILHCADHMDLISEHFYCKEKEDVAEHVAQMPESIRAKVEAHRDYRERLSVLEGKDIRIAMDEWNYWYGEEFYGELGYHYYWKDGLGIAAGLHEFFRHSDIVAMANYAQTVNALGCIKTTETAAALETTGLVLKLYRDQFGTLPLSVTASEEPLDIAAALTEDRKTLTIAVVNPTDEARDIDLDLAGVNLTGAGRQWQIAHPDPMVYNEPGRKPAVVIEEAAACFDGRLFVQPYSVTLLALDVQ